MSEIGNVGERFARALAAKDRGALLGALARDVDFRGLTPHKNWEASSGEDFVDRVLLGSWFEPTDRIKALRRVETDSVADTGRVAYRLELENGEGQFLCEQQAYYRTVDERISWLRIVCSGFRPLRK